MRVIIAGGRDFDNYELLCQRCDHLLSMQNDITVICGMARGADLFGKRYAEERGYEVVCFPADWDTYGKAAGYRRNAEMAEYAAEGFGALIAFWNGASKGTKHMIDLAKQKHLSVRVVRYYT